MRVGVHIGAAEPQSGGGFTFVEEVLENLKACASSSRHQFVVLASSSDTASHAPLETERLPPHSPISIRARRRAQRELGNLLGQPEAPFVGSDPRVDGVLAAARLDLVWHLCPNAWLSLDLPYITTVWDLQHRLQPFFPEVSSGGQYFFREAIHAPLLRRAALIVTGTEVGRREIERFYGIPPERIRVLPQPTPRFALAAGEDAPGPRSTLAPQGPYLLYPAQFWPHKNHINLLHALALLRERDRDPPTLVLTGSDHGNADFVSKATQGLGLEAHVRMLGFVPRTELVSLYRSALALTFMTYFGPDNLPPLEAFAVGCPVIASSVPGAAEQLADAAVLVNPSRPDEIASAIARVRDEPALCQTLISRGKARAGRWTGKDYVAGALEWMDEFEPVRRNWPSGLRQWN